MKNVIATIVVWTLLAVINFVGCFHYTSLFFAFCGWLFFGFNCAAILGFILLWKGERQQNKLVDKLKQDEL